jgi:hypothetical protein
MFKFIAILASLTSAAAFAPASQRASSSAMQMASSFKNAIGAQAPLGFWDPLGLLEDADQEKFDLYRSIETKHGRVAMMAVLGHIVTTAGVRLPGDIAYGTPFSSVKNGFAALETMPAFGIFQIILFVGVLEIGYTSRKEEIESVHLAKSKWNQATIDKKLAIELNNGRAAQMGILGLMVHEKINNDPYVLNALLGSPVPFN